MSNDEPNTEDRAELIGRIYDVVLSPEKTNDFVAEWEKYISHLCAGYADRQNAMGESEVLIDDDGLEMHFSRAFTLMEQNERVQSSTNSARILASQSALLSFSSDGTITHMKDCENNPFTECKTSSELAAFMEETDAKSWRRFLQDFKRSPRPNKFQIFSTEEQGLLVATIRRGEDGFKFVCDLQQLKISWNEGMDVLLSEQFNLTNAEVNLAQQLSIHGSLDALSSINGRSKHTLRSQLKAVFKKLKVRSQAEALQSLTVLSQFCMTIGHDREGFNKEVELGEILNLPLSNGGQIPVHLMGPEDGHPVIFIHGMLDGVAMTAEVIDALHEHKVRFIAPIRPNFGAADPSEEKVEAPNYFARQLREVVTALSLKDVILLGHMSGSVFSFAAASYLADRVLGVVNISGGVPILSTKQFSSMSTRQKAFAYTARFAPKFLPTLCRTGIQQIDALSAESLIHDLYAKDTVDRAASSKKEVTDVLADGYRFSVTQGYQAFLVDAYHVTRNWSELVHRCHKPVLLVHGKHDPVVRMEDAKTLSEKENFDFILYPDDGQLVLYAKPDEVIKNIVSFIDKCKAS